jgi:hypothetical protein
MMIKPKNRIKRRSGLYPLAALGGWLALLAVVLTVEPGTLASYFVFLALFTLALAFSIITIFLLVNRRLGKNLNPRSARRRAWLLAAGSSVLAALQLFRLTSLFHLLLIAAIIILLEIYLSS